ncbi:ATP-binding protein [Nocardia tengchongensis]|uniref:ATP-binding protein n=1 Tax=Nocardia tengchongensis TaxID=2055889 RepID=UPI00365B2DD3
MSAEYDISSIFDPLAEEPVPVVPPGALPPSWAAARAGSASTGTVGSNLAWSQAQPMPPVPMVVDVEPTIAESAAPERGPKASSHRGRRKRRRERASESVHEIDRQRAEAGKRVDSERKQQRLALIGTHGNITRTRTVATAWFVQPPGPWNMRPVAKQRRFIRNEGLVLSRLSEVGVTSLHRRLVRTPWPVRQWAQAHDAWADPIPDVPGALSWADYLRGQQHAMLWGEPTLKGRYWGIDLPNRSGLGQALDQLAYMLSFVESWPLLGGVAVAVSRWAEDAFAREREAMNDYLATLERVMDGRGVRARPATAAQMDYLLRRSASIGLPMDVDGVIAGGGDWVDTDIAALEDITDAYIVPGDGYTTVSGVVGGARYTAYVVVLTVGRMAALPIPERMLPWQVIGDPLGEALEWSERIRLRTASQTLREMRRLANKVKSQFEHYTVEHDETPPQELTEQYALSQRIISDVEEDHSGLSARTEGWYRVAVVGSSVDDVRQKVARLKEAYSPHISLEQEHGQYQLLREFIPGERLANIAHARRMGVYEVSAGMAAVGDRIGDRTGVVLGETASIAPRPALWDLFAAHERKQKSGLTPIVAVPGSGKTFLAGMICYQGVRAGAYAVILDPSGPLKKLANLPELRGVSEVHALTGRSSRPGSLNPYRVIVDPRRDDPDYSPRNPDFARDANPVAAAAAQYEADVRAAAAERISVAVSVLKMMLPPSRLEIEWTESVLHQAANKVGGERHHNLREVLDAIEEIASSDDDMAVRTCARAIFQDLDIMSQLTEARVLFPDPHAPADAGDGFDADRHLTILTMPGVQLPPEGVDPSQWTAQQRMTVPLMYMAAWLANRLVYEKPRHMRKILFLDENKYLEQTGAGRTLNHRIARDSRKFKVRALVCSQLPDDFLGIDGTDDKSALTYEVIIGELGGNAHAIEGALKLLNLPAGEGYESVLAELGGGGEDTLDEDTDTSSLDQARRFLVKMADDVELIRCDWRNFTHLAHVFEALNSSGDASFGSIA